jgi:hypothetical protein
VAADERSAQAELAHSALQLADRRGRILAWEGVEGGEPRGYSRTTSAAKSLACLAVEMAAPASVIPRDPRHSSPRCRFGGYTLPQISAASALLILEVSVTCALSQRPTQLSQHSCHNTAVTTLLSQHCYFFTCFSFHHVTKCDSIPHKFGQVTSSARIDLASYAAEGTVRLGEMGPLERLPA